MQIIFLLLLFYFGWNLTKIFIIRLHYAEHLGLAILLGMGIYTLVYYYIILYLRILPLNSHLIILLTLTFLASTITRIFGLKIKYSAHSRVKLSKLESFALLISVLIFSYIALQNWYWPPYTPDSIHLYEFRAQRLLVNDIDGFFHGAHYINSNNYPPFTSLLHYFFYIYGYVNPTNGYTLLLAAFLVTIYGYIHRLTSSRTKGILVVTLILLTPSIWWNALLALTNIPLMEYFSLAILYLCDSLYTNKLRSPWIVAGILLGTASFIRQEAFWIPIVLASLLIALKRRTIIQFLSFISIFFVISAIWPLSISWISPVQHLQIETNTVIRIMNDISANNNLAYFGALYTALQGLWKSWGLIVIMFYLMMIAQILWFKIHSVSLVQIFGIYMSISLIVGFIIFARRFVGWASLEDAVLRMGVIIIPIFWVGVSSSPILNLLLNKGKT